MLRQIAQRLMPYATEYSGINAGFRAYQRNHLLVLCYHGVIPDEIAPYSPLYGNSVTVGEFNQQMLILVRHFRPIGAHELPDWICGKADVREKSVLVTFDDGYRNNLTHALPVLRRFRIPALLFVSTGYVGKNRILWPDEMYARVLSWPRAFVPMPPPEGDRHIGADLRERAALAAYVRETCKRIPHEESMAYLNRLREYDLTALGAHAAEIFNFLSWDEIRELKASGFEIGSHTIEHPILTRVGPDQLAHELTESKRIIEQKLDCPCPYFAYPNGGPEDISAAVIAAVRRAGYSFAFSVTDQLSSRVQDPILLDRVFIPAGLSEAAFHTRISGVYGRVALCLGRRALPQGRVPIRTRTDQESVSA